MGPAAYDLSHFSSDVKNNTFIGSLPPALVQSSALTESQKKSKENKKKENDSRSVANDNKKPEWIISKNKRINEVLSKEAMSSIPSLKPGV